MTLQNLVLIDAIMTMLEATAEECRPIDDAPRRDFHLLAIDYQQIFFILSAGFLNVTGLPHAGGQSL